MSRTIRINHPGDGAWIMARAEGNFDPATSHSIAAASDGEIIGGFVMCDYLGAAMTIHMAGNDRRWCSRDLMWMLFDYVFNQLGCHKALATVRSDNGRALALDLRAGFQLEATVRDVFADGVHLMVLTMSRDNCPWLRIKPSKWRAGTEGTAV